ncbi:hypothetical protein ACEPVM_31660, partial [Pseudomonas aeruginosa]
GWVDHYRPPATNTNENNNALGIAGVSHPKKENWIRARFSKVKIIADKATTTISSPTSILLSVRMNTSIPSRSSL